MISHSDDVISALLQKPATFAIVGASANSERPSAVVSAYLARKGYSIVPVNPGLAGQTLNGSLVYARLTDIPGPVDIVDIFRASDAALGVVREAIAEKDRLGIKGIWMQLGVINEEAAREAEAAGLKVVMDRCPKIEHARLAL